MKLVHLTIALGVCGALCTANVFAQQLRQPASMHLASSDLDYFSFLDDVEEEEDITESPSDMVIEDDPIEPVAIQDYGKDEDKGDGKDCGKGCGDGKGCGKGCGCGPMLCVTGDPVSVWDSIMGCHDSCLNIGGWVQAGFYNYNTGMFNDYPHSLNVNQAWVYAEKEADGSCGLDWGFRFDYVYGTDGPDTQAFGNPPNRWDFGWNNGNFYGHAIPQLYVDVAYHDLNIRLGHFYTIAGYEVVPAPDNFFYSHAFTMYHAEPFTHTGALASYALGDNIEVYGGWTSGFDTGFDRFGGDIFLGGISVSLTENITAVYTNTFGNIGFGSNATGYSHTLVVDFALTEKLNYVFQTDFIDYRGNFNVVPPAPVLVHRYGINQYLFYEINDCLEAGVRFEWFNAENLTGGGRSDLYEVTFGINYKPHPNFRIRPEIRWDKDDDAFTVDPARNETLGFGMDIIFTF